MKRVSSPPFDVDIGDMVLSVDDLGVWCIFLIRSRKKNLFAGSIVRGTMHKRMSIGQRHNSDGCIFTSGVFWKTKVAPEQIDYIVEQITDLSKSLIKAREVFHTKVALL